LSREVPQIKAISGSTNLTWEQLQKRFPDADPIACVLELIDWETAEPRSEHDPEFHLITKSWPHLPSHIRQVILTIVRSVDKFSEEFQR
jgi:hypothetical protein